MKKYFIVTLILVCSLSVRFSFAKNDQIDGLGNNINSLFADSIFSSQELAQMQQNWDRQYEEWLRSNGAPWNQIIKPFYADLENKTKEESIEYLKKKYRPDFSAGLYKTKIQFSNYVYQYSCSNKLCYLLASGQYWTAPNENGLMIKMIHDGNMLNFWQNATFNGDIMLTRESIEYLHRIDDIEKQLIELGGNTVNKVALFDYLRVSFLYIKCGEREYLVKLDNVLKDNNNYYLQKVESFVVLPANEVMNLFLGESARIDTTPKPDYTTEAEYLAGQGLLYGNENGLDLLKPMTRAEAATILMRALGGENQTPQVASFSDVPTNYWGFEPIEKASRLGIVKGVGDGLFEPEARVTENQFATMLLRTANETDFDWQTAINLFVERGYITQEQADRMDLFTRGDMAKLIYEAKQHGMIVN